jgi:hypothetical protein
MEYVIKIIKKVLHFTNKALFKIKVIASLILELTVYNNSIVLLYIESIYFRSYSLKELSLSIQVS